MSYQALPVKDILRLEKKRFRDELGIFLVEGKKVFHEAKISGLPVLQILATEKFANEQRDFLQTEKIDFRSLTIISEYNAEKLSGTTTPSGIFAVVQKPETSFADVLAKKYIAVLENVRDPGNVGTMLRTAEWFGVEAVIVSEGADPYNDKVIRSAMGSLFRLPVYVSRDLVGDLTQLKKNGFTVLVTRPEASGKTLPQEVQKLCVVMGNESLGTSQEIDEMADITYAIPQVGQAESLNVAVSFGITLFDLMQKKLLR